MREVQHGTPQTRKCRRTGHGGSPNPAGDVDQRVYPMEDLTELLQENLHQEVAVCGHGIVKQRLFHYIMVYVLATRSDALN